MNRKRAGTGISLKTIKENSSSYIGILPFFVLFLLFTVIPLTTGLFRSFTDWSMSSRGKINFVGLENYNYLISGEGTTSTRFLKSMVNMAIYVPITVAIGLFMSLMLALVVNQFKGRIYRFFRSVYFVPTVLPVFLCVAIWKWFMTPSTGHVTSLLASMGIGVGVNWAETSGYAIANVIFINVWNAVGFNFLIISAAMKDISPDLYEAAEIDGASTFQKMKNITIPLLEPILFFAIIYAFIKAIQVYDIPWILSGYDDMNSVGGPNQVMLFPVMEMVRNVYSGGNFGLGRACAMGVILMFIIMIITLIQFRFRKKRL
ncbi:MAG TPA: sugar ABC transporter permease [Clostridiales bacterium]|nr:sugar ABC transporter permease [Clostridia bacterium]HCS76003.1 sugar ABC transporter permease [Clostridiales bacterium]